LTIFGAAFRRAAFDAVVGRRMDAHHRDAEQPGRVHGPAVIGREDPALDLAHPLVQKLLSDGDVDAVGGQEVGLEPHDLVKLGQGDPLRMMGDDEVDPLVAVPVEGMGQEDLPHFHVDPDDHLLHFDGRVAGQDPRVGEGIEQAVFVPGLTGGALELFGLGPLLVQDPAKFFGASQVVGHADGDGVFVERF
jgi:hypothetical protein